MQLGQEPEPLELVPEGLELEQVEPVPVLVQQLHYLPVGSTLYHQHEVPF